MGEISRLKKVVREPVFRQRIEKNKKGKGSYSRKDKKVVSEDSKAFTSSVLESSPTKRSTEDGNTVATFEKRSTGGPQGPL